MYILSSTGLNISIEESSQVYFCVCSAGFLNSADEWEVVFVFSSIGFGITI